MSRMRKYHNHKITENGKTFDSKKEFQRWQELRLLERGGKIENLQRQVPFELVPAMREPPTIGPRGGVKQGRTIEKAVTYVADFVYEQDGKTVVEDTKGVRTADYIIKRKLMLWKYGIRVVET